MFHDLKQHATNFAVRDEKRACPSLLHLSSDDSISIGVSEALLPRCRRDSANYLRLSQLERRGAYNFKLPFLAIRRIGAPFVTASDLLPFPLDERVAP